VEVGKAERNRQLLRKTTFKIDQMPSSSFVKALRIKQKSDSINMVWGRCFSNPYSFPINGLNFLVTPSHKIKTHLLTDSKLK